MNYASRILIKPDTSDWLSKLNLIFCANLNSVTKHYDMKTNNFRDDGTDISAKTNSLLGTCVAPNVSGLLGHTCSST